ncbi:MAG: electron transfer flavoprotein subunit alpha/FixB family protein [Balneolaceae bacterium]
MSTLLTYVSIQDGRIKRSSLDLLSRCSEEAEKNGHRSAALLIDESASGYASELSTFGLSKIYIVEGPRFKNRLNGPLLKAFSTVLKQVKPAVLSLDSTEESKDVLGALSASTGAPVLPDLSQFELTENGVKGKRPVMASKILSLVEAVGKPVIFSVRSKSHVQAPARTPSRADVEKIDVSVTADDMRATLREIRKAKGSGMDLSEAETIVAAGRGVRDEKGLNLIYELAGVLQAGIGASRALTESGVFDSSLQIGQTGKVVSPQLYIAVGISGAIQHVAGMTNSRIIVAINSDPSAPIFDIADYGIVGDLYKVLPPFIEEIRSFKS